MRIVPDMPFQQYLDHDALSRSVLDKIAKSPRHLQHFLEHGEDETAAMIQGRAAHTLLLEPGKFWEGTAVWRGAVRRGKEWDAFQEQHPGKDLITASEETMLRGMEKSFREHELAGRLLDGAAIETSAFWKWDGIECKARPDIIKGSLIVDLKTAADASPAEFTKNAFRFGYHRQAAWYLAGLSAATGKKFEHFAFLVIEKEAPYDIAYYVCDDKFLAIGHQENEANFALYSDCVKSGKWPGFLPVAQQLSLPRWAL